MAQLMQQGAAFDAMSVEPAKALDPIPAGWYNLRMIASENKPTSKSTEQVPQYYLEMQFEVIDGQYAGRKIYDRLNLKNENATAEKIAYEQLSAICRATNSLKITDSAELHNKPLMGKVSLRPAGVNPQNNQAYEANNEIKGYKAIEVPTSTLPGTSGTTLPTGGAPPWAPPTTAVAPSIPPPTVPAAAPWAPPVPIAAPPPQPPAVPTYTPTAEYPQAAIDWAKANVGGPQADAILKATLVPAPAPAPAAPPAAPPVASKPPWAK